MLWTLLSVISCSASNQTDLCDCGSTENVEGNYSNPCLVPKDDSINYSSIHWAPLVSDGSSRSKRYSGQVEVLTITVDSHLMEGLKEVVSQYLKENQVQKPDSYHENYDDDYHYDDEIHIGVGHLIGTFTSGATRFYTPWQCIWRHCSIGLFSTSGQGMATWSLELTVTILFFHFCWSYYNSSYLVI